MVLHKKHTMDAPLLVRLALLVVVVFYSVSLVAFFVVTFFARGRDAPRIAIIYPEDAMYILEVYSQDSNALPDWWLDGAEALHRGNPGVLFALARYYLHQGQGDRGMTFVQRANEADPFNKEYRNAWVELLMNQGRTAQLQQDLETIGFEGLEEKWTPGMYAFGLERIQQDDPMSAVPFWWAASEISPSSSHMWIEYAALLVSLGDADRADRVLGQCETDSLAGAHCREARTFFRRGEPTPVGYYKDVILAETR